MLNAAEKNKAGEGAGSSQLQGQGTSVWCFKKGLQEPRPESEQGLDHGTAGEGSPFRQKATAADGGSE